MPLASPRITTDPRSRCPTHRPRASTLLTPSVAAGVALLTIGEPTLAQQTYAVAAITTEGAGPLGLGALVGAVVAGGFALRERFRRD